MSMADRDKQADDMFACSRRERAAFEAGIKMATIYHQFVGTPVNLDSVAGLEDAMSRAIEVQPYVKSAKVTIPRKHFNVGGDRYSYISLMGNMIDAVVEIDLEGTIVVAEMRFDENLDYPLMYISKIE